MQQMLSNELSLYQSHSSPLNQSLPFGWFVLRSPVLHDSSSSNHRSGARSVSRLVIRRAVPNQSSTVGVASRLMCVCVFGLLWERPAFIISSGNETLASLGSTLHLSSVLLILGKGEKICRMRRFFVLDYEKCTSEYVLVLHLVVSHSGMFIRLFI